MKSKGKWVTLCIFIILVVLLAIFLNATVNVLEERVTGFTPVRDDEAARRFAPGFISNDDFGFPHACWYRAARDKKGNLHLAYHPVWEYERNNAGGLMPFLSRILYTGGLSIQRFMFGKGDVEVISAIISPEGKIIALEYERPKNYNPSTFIVEHETQKIEKTIEHMPTFRVASWNHLFEIATEDTHKKTGERTWHCNPEYFTDDLWNEYTMVRLKETRLRKSRAHLPWERVGVK